MKFSRLFFSSAIFSSAVAEEECRYALELLALQDGSGSFANHIDKWAATAEDLISRLGTEFGEYKMALSSFTDKPIPKSGYGQYGGWGEYMQDYCYSSHVPMSTSSETLIQGLNELRAMIGAGFDAPEAQAEAMIFAALDDSIGWSQPNVTHSESGRPIARILMLITDEKSHEAGNAAASIAKYNAPRSYPNGYDQPSTGGFGAHDFPSKTSLVNEGLGDGTLYKEMADLFAKSDAFEAGATKTALTESEKARLDELIKMFGPYPYPTLVYPQHPGDNSVPDCKKTEYPSLDQMVEALKLRGILPIFLTSTSKAYDFYEWYRVNLFESMGLESIVAMFNSETLFDDMIASINSLVAKKCIASTTTTTTPAPTEEPSQDALTTEEGGIIIPPAGDHDSTPSADGTEGVAEDTTATTTTHIKTKSTSTTTTKPHGNSDDAEETETVMAEVSTTEDEVQPPVIPPPIAEGSSTGTIAGATAGATAGLAALGGLLYKTVGAGMFGGNPTGVEGVEQMEVPESPVEREAMEEVTMDMFH